MDRQPQIPPRGIEREEFCRDINGLSLPRDHEERGNFDQQDAFILGDPAACFDRPCGHHYDRKFDNPYMQASQSGRRYFYMSSKIVGILKTAILFMSWSILETWPITLQEILVFHTGQQQ